MLTRVPSQANHSSPPIAVGSRRRFSSWVKIVRRVAHKSDSCVRVSTLLRNWHTSQTPWSVFRNGNDERIENTLFLVYHCLGPGTGSGRHDEMDTVPNSQVRRRTVMASGALSDTEGGMMFNWSRLWPWAATPHCDRESRRLRQ